MGNASFTTDKSLDPSQRLLPYFTWAGKKHRGQEKNLWGSTQNSGDPPRSLRH